MRFGSFFCKILFLFVLFFQKEIQSGSHRRGSGRWGFDVESESGIPYGLGGRGAECPYLYFVLFEVGEILYQRFDSRGAEKEKHIVVERLAFFEVVAYRTVHDGFRIVDFMFFQYSGLLFMYVGNGEEEFFARMFQQRRYKVVEFPGISEKYFTFAIDDVLLQIEGDGFCRAEIFHRFGYVDAQFLAQTEEMVYGCTGGENDRRIFGNRDFLLPELFGCKTLHLDERTKDDIYSIFFGNIVVG